MKYINAIFLSFAVVGIFLFFLDITLELLILLPQYEYFPAEQILQLLAALIGLVISIHYIKRYFSNWNQNFHNSQVRIANRINAGIFTIGILVLLAKLYFLTTCKKSDWFCGVSVDLTIFFGLSFIVPALFLLSYILYIRGTKKVSMSVPSQVN